ncbi:TonB-linked outer membrane protein, SusC/RagA family [Pedobacter sp. ok626]|uniref:SusC/RagA family TonB-linked outer membrane protein n=1 Tax=Pedobacter sp. ok626 TaxID=1761882 RepID=UPI0008882B55|nr:TonB-dependent receptor [Pedobacter sp. ok626]SDI98629.1 TonB-linked outer membrane protein, SusC/RagA family [Pedobacter sp. ok626]
MNISTINNTCKRYLKAATFNALRVSIIAFISFVSAQNCFGASQQNPSTTTKTLSDSTGILISGLVRDSNSKLLARATVSEKNGKTTSITDAGGKFSLRVSNRNAVLKVSYLGLETKEIPINSQRFLQIVLNASQSKLDEVVIIGYGTSDKKDLTGSISSLKGEDIKSATATSFVDALQGKIAGVRVNSQSGEPGAGVSVEIRGGNSINGSSSPLYVIDGVQIEMQESEVASSKVGGRTTLNPLSTISPDQIASVDILKDASATAIYGARGANGVIIVTTKSGKSGSKPVFNLSSSYASSEITKRIDVLDAQDYVQYRFLRSPNDRGFGTDLDNDGVPDVVRDVSALESYDWQDAIFRRGATQKYNLSGQGGSNSSSYSFGLGYSDQDALVINNDFKTYSARFQYNHRVSDKLDFSLTGNWGKTKTRGVASSGGGEGNFSGLIQAAYTFQPVLIKAVDDSFTPVSLLDQLLNSYKLTDFDRLIGNANLTYAFTKKLKLRVSGGGSSTSSKLSEFYGKNTLWGQQDNGKANNNHTQTGNYQAHSTLDYWTKTANRQVLKAMIGAEFNSYNYENFGTSISNFQDQSTGVFNLAKGLTPGFPSSNFIEQNRISFFSRLNYDISNKYLFTATLRNDNSSQLGPGNRSAFFPSAAFAWRIKEEKFLKNNQIFSDLKLRLSYGVTGNDRIPAYRFLSELGTTSYAGNGTVRFGLSPISSENLNLKWESTAQYDVGLDLSLFNNRVNMTTDIYYKSTKDLLLLSEVASQTGFPTQWQNIGEISNKGLEITINSVNINTADFKWNTTFNISFNRNKIVSLGGTESKPVIFNNGYINNVGIVKEGQPIGTAFGYVWDGIYQINDFTWQNNSDAAIPHQSRTYTIKNGITSISGAQPGLFKYKDQNGDGIINASDRTVISNSNPKFSGGFSSNFTFRNFSVNAFFEGGYGNQIFNEFPTRVESGSGQVSFNLTQQYWDNRWTPENPSNRYASISSANTDAEASSYYVENGSYLRFKTLSFGYSLKNNGLLKATGISNLNLLLTLDNLYVWTNYSGFDPDVRSNDKLLPGYDRLAYPRSRSIIFGLELTF